MEADRDSWLPQTHNLLMTEQQRIESIVSALDQTLGGPPEVAVVLGSGWKVQATGLLSDLQEVALTELPDWPKPRVLGHGGDLQMGQIDGRKTLLCGGRVHSYEGHPSRELVRGVRALVAWGTPNILLLNAAGSLLHDMPPGTLMAFEDHLNLGLPNPLQADQSLSGKAEFVDLVNLYQPQWRDRLLGQCPDVRSGIYAGMPGPSYETPAEIALLQKLGAHAVGMSTIPEAIAAKALGAKVMAVSLVTNMAAGLAGSQPNHLEVLQTAAAHGARAAQVLAAAVATAPA
jgi:purine-nucleoside phosphorylase